MDRRPRFLADTQVVPEPKNGSRTTSSLYEYRRIRRLGSSSGYGAGCPTRTGFAPENVQVPRLYSMKSLASISQVFPWSGRFQVSLKKTGIISTGAVTNGADGFLQLPQAVRREMFCSFQTIVV